MPGSLRDSNLLDLCAFRLDDDMARAAFASGVPAYFHLGGDVGQPRGLDGRHAVRERCAVVGARYLEEKEIKIPMYKPVTVFDVSQTALSCFGKRSYLK